MLIRFAEVLSSLQQYLLQPNTSRRMLGDGGYGPVALGRDLVRLVQLVPTLQSTSSSPPPRPPSADFELHCSPPHYSATNQPVLFSFYFAPPGIIPPRRFRLELWRDPLPGQRWKRPVAPPPVQKRNTQGAHPFLSSSGVDCLLESGLPQPPFNPASSCCRQGRQLKTEGETKGTAWA